MFVEAYEALRRAGGHFNGIYAGLPTKNGYKCYCALNSKPGKESKKHMKNYFTEASKESGFVVKEFCIKGTMLTICIETR